MVYIYVLRCKQNKYYVGKTNNPSMRMEDHIKGQGSEWTKMYEPIELHTLILDCDNFDEDKYVKKYMARYGIDNVRGGTHKLNYLNKR
jgi:predicted GIY-YIG superfamily endonuclease